MHLIQKIKYSNFENQVSGIDTALQAIDIKHPLQFQKAKIKFLC